MLDYILLIEYLTIKLLEKQSSYQQDTIFVPKCKIYDPQCSHTHSLISLINIFI
jgi:hypothetical protein